MKHFNIVVLGAGGVGKSSLTLRYMHQLFLDTYDPTIEEAYLKTLTVDGEMCRLEILDTAGAGQFTAINEFYTRGQSGYVLVFSLTSANSLREVESIRHQIFRSKGLPMPPLFDWSLGHPSSATHPRVPRRINSRPNTASSSYGSSDTLPPDKFSHRPSGPGGRPVASTIMNTSRDVSLYGIPFVLVGTKSDLTSEREVSRDVLMKVATLWRCPCYETSAKKDWNVQEVFMDIARQMKNTFPYGSNAPLEPSVPAKKKKRHFGCVVQ